MRVLTPQIHRGLDYLTVIIFLLAPSILGFSGLSAVLARILAFVHLIMTSLTAFPPSTSKIISFHLHGWVERIVGPVLVVLSFVPGIARDTVSMLFFLIMGIVIVGVGFLTDYAPQKTPQ